MPAAPPRRVSPDVPRPPLAGRVVLAFVIASAAMCLAALLLWPRSNYVNDQLKLPGPGNAVLHFSSSEGSVRFGVFEEPAGPRFFRPRRLDLDDLGGGRGVVGAVADPWGWGLAIPHPLLALIGAIAPAWWLLVHRRRAALGERVERNLCPDCGYDLRATRDRCPECGRPIDAVLRVGEEALPEG